MKKIGLVGGTGPESTLMYYKELNSRIDNLTGEKAMPEIAIESVNFRRAWEYVCNKDYDALSDYLAEKVKCLEASGCEGYILEIGTSAVFLMACREAGIDEETGKELAGLIDKKSIPDIEKMVKGLGLTAKQELFFQKLALMSGIDVFARTEELCFSDSLLQEIRKLERLKTMLEELGYGEHVRFDLGNPCESCGQLAPDLRPFRSPRTRCVRCRHRNRHFKIRGACHTDHIYRQTLCAVHLHQRGILSFQDPCKTCRQIRS